MQFDSSSVPTCTLATLAASQAMLVPYDPHSRMPTYELKYTTIKQNLP